MSAVRLDKRLSHAAEALWLATLDFVGGYEANPKAASAALSALWAAIDPLDRAELHRFISCWNDGRAALVFDAIAGHPAFDLALATLTLEDRNRQLAHVLRYGWLLSDRRS